MTTQPRGKIVTFYSYKGGVGRSMALANIGVLLAQMGKKVLLVDWDLEAPGLEHYFESVTVSRPKRYEGGLLELLNHAPNFRKNAADSAVTTYRLDRRSEISILTSGAESLTYATTLADFAWSDYFAKKQGGQFLEQLREHWIASYDYVLIDSRTGVTDSGGICTILMPDVLFLLFAANQQNLNGIIRIGKLARQGRSQLYYPRLSLSILPIPSRFDGRVEKATASKWLNRISIECLDFYSDWIAEGIECKTLIEQIKVPYIPQYSFDEGLPVLKEGTSDPEQIGYYYRNIATLLTSDEPFDGELRHVDTDGSTLVPSVGSVSQPRVLYRVFVSSTFVNLREHRSVVIDALSAAGLDPVVMENSPAAATDLLSSSLEMVRSSAAFVLILGLKYGQIPKDDARNPRGRSIGELEFDEALRLNKPILLFIMGDEHPVKKADIELDREKEQKLDVFRERATRITPDSTVQRVYSVFNSLDEFKDKAVTAIAELVRAIAFSGPSIPRPPAFYAKPDYIGRHDFVGRKAQLQLLTDWAKPTDADSILLFEAIGGNGKSMLTWEWTTKHAEAARAGHEPWAGRFWYSFYEKGAIMRDFCLHALNYMTRQPMVELEKKPMADLRIALLAQLHARPWLLILDGLERVLVAYQRIDAAEVRDEEVNRPTDRILDRDPCDAIRPEDTELLRALTSAKPSKILISSRLIPRVLLNPSGLPLPGVRPLVLPGLDDADAERLFCEVCGIRGTSADIRYYLRTFCDNHPLVIDLLAGLINSPGPHRGHFDAWAAAPESGAKLNLASLDLIQSRNHILRSALHALEPASRQLLSTLALLSGVVDYDTVAAFNPHLPRDERKLSETLQDLESRGLVKYDGRTQRFSLHPVVRGVAVGEMKDEDRDRYGERVVEHFASQPRLPYEKIRTMDDVASGLHVVRTLLKLGHFQRAAAAYQGYLSNALLFNLEAYVEILALLRPFFPAGWDTLPDNVEVSTACYLANEAAIALNYCGELPKALGAFGAALRASLKIGDWNAAGASLSRISENLSAQNLMANALRVDALTVDLSTVIENHEAIFKSLLNLFADQSRLGQWQDADATWRQLDPMGRVWGRAVYRQGRSEYHFAEFHFWQGSLQEEHLTAAATLAEQDGNRQTLRSLHGLRGAWRLEQGEWALAAASFDTAVTMAREVRLVDEESETGLALAKHHLGQLTGAAARSEAERLAQITPGERLLAQLWLAIGDPDQAKHHALAAYRWAWADGEPYVHRYALTKTTELLQQMNVPVPVLPPYDESKDEPFPWEADVRAAIEKLKAEKTKPAPLA